MINVNPKDTKDVVISPWSVCGKYVRRCMIIYERISFDKLVTLCKQASTQFKHLSATIAKSRQIILKKNSDDNSKSDKLKGATETPIYADHPIDPNYEIDNSNSPTTGALFLNDESNLTITFFNRSANVDCSGMGMDLEPLEEVLNPSSANNNPNASNVNTSKINTSLNTSMNRDFLSKLNSQTRLNVKALTSTVSAQRTQSVSSFKPNGNKDEDGEARDSNVGTAKKGVTFCLDLNQGAPGTPEVTSKRAEESDKSMPLFDTNSQSLAITNSCAFSRKIAEYFVAQQAHLIENNEHEALSPVELQLKIDELISYDSSYADAYYLKYLNCVRLKDYPLALKALHDYFDRLLLAGSVSLAALNLCSLEYRFDNK